jgi:uncharacterized protein (DUF58 family)
MILPLVWALLAALALVLSWVTGAPSFAWVGYLMLALLVFGVVAARLGERGLTASRRLSADRMSLGGQIEVEVQVENRSRLPALWVAAAETRPAGLAMTGVRGRVGPLAGGARFHFRYTLQGGRRGYYQIGPTVLRTGDLFGLSQREHPAGPPSGLIVFPGIVAIRHGRLPSRRVSTDVRARHRVFEDPVQVIGIRPYQHSDGLRRIHWRASAHTGQLQSKLFEPFAQIETAIALSLRRSDYPAHPVEAEETAELAIVTAASVAYHVLDRRQRTGLLAVGRDPITPGMDAPLRLRPARGREQLAAILSTLGRISLGPAGSLAATLQRERQQLAWGSLLVVITPSVDDDLLRAALTLRRTGFDVSFVLVGRAPRQASTQAGLEAMGISATRVRSEVDIRGLGL